MVNPVASDDAWLPAQSRLSRITPRTCLWPLAGSLVVTFGLSIGLTFRSDHHCFAGTCGEWLFPLQTRLHVVVWYAWLSVSVTFLAVRAFHPEMQKFLARPLAKRKLPLLGKSVSLGGGLMVLWILALYGVVVGVWWIKLRDYFIGRNTEAGIDNGSGRLAAVALTGHMCDVTMGMVLLPISRHSALASFFKIAVSTTITNHMLTAYTLFTLVLVHGFLYVAWVPVFQGLSTALQRVIPVLNPTYLYTETWPGNLSRLGVWRASLVFTGLSATAIMSAIFVTTFPKVRARNFNLFYFTHLFSILMVVIICLHASTMFYCTAPGLAMWLLDWGMRLYELRRALDGNISMIGNGWYSVTLPLPRARLAGCSCRSPLAHFYIHHAGSSFRELHPFTTITHLASKNSITPLSDEDLQIQFLFRKQGKPPPPGNDHPAEVVPLRQRLFRSKKQRLQSVQWTNRLAGLIDGQSAPLKHIDSTASSASPKYPTMDVALRLEGPYFSPADPSRYDTVVCLVGGTGVSGAIAIAAAFNERVQIGTDGKQKGSTPPATPRWHKCVIIWSVKEADDIDLPFFSPMSEGLELRKCLTGGGRDRVDLKQMLTEAVKAGERNWVYISGPPPYIDAAKGACELVQQVAALDVYAAD